MKKLLIYLPAILGLLWSCDPMEDTYNKLDNKLEPYKENKAYTLVAADYSTASKAALVDALNKADSAKAKLVASSLSFNNRFTVNDYAKYVLLKVFPALKDNSNVSVTYNSFSDYDTASVELRYTLLTADYDAMGTSTGFPGKYDNFDVTMNPAFFIPIWLKSKYPYAKANDVILIRYKYYTKASGGLPSSTELLKMAFIYDGTNWARTPKVSNFLYTDNVWKFDPTVRLTPIAADFQLLVDWVYANKGRSFGSSYGNDEFYYGASAYQKNFDLRISNKTTYNVPGFAELATTAEKIAKTWSMLEEGISTMLMLKYPAAVVDVNGLVVYYWVTFGTYENDLAKNTYVGIFKCITPGTPPVFVRDKAFEDAQVTAGKLTSAQVKWNRP